MTAMTEVDLENLIAAFDVMDCGAAVYDGNYQPLYANQRTRDHFPILYDLLAAGTDLRTGVEQSVRAIGNDLTEAQIQAYSDEFTRKVQGFEPVEFPTHDGRVVRTYHAPMPDGGVVGLSTDVTELRRNEKALKKAEAAANAANRAKSEFLAAMSHEIRTPLNGVLGMAQALSSRPLPEEERDMVDTIVQSSKALMTILNDILDLSKIEAGKLDLSPVPNDLRHKLRQVERLQKEQALSKGLDFRMVVAPSVPTTLVFDPVRVRQCVLNLVSNAIKFTQSGAVHVAVASEDLGDDTVRVIVHVRDTGIGIAPDVLPTLFQNFRQGDRSTAREYGGSGLGLSITRQLLQKMGGDVSVVSREGEGSVFTMSFTAETAPAKPETGETPTETAQSSPPATRPDLSSGSLSGIRVLIVDDNSINRRVARMLLEPFGLDMEEASSGEMALKCLEGASFDLVLLDIHMPNMDGPETFKRIRASSGPSSNIPVIALTADAMDRDREKYLALGMDGYACKPIEEREMVGAIMSALLRTSRSLKAG